MFWLNSWLVTVPEAFVSLLLLCGIIYLVWSVVSLYSKGLSHHQYIYCYEYPHIHDKNKGRGNIYIWYEKHYDMDCPLPPAALMPAIICEGNLIFGHYQVIPICWGCTWPFIQTEIEIKWMELVLGRMGSCSCMWLGSVGDNISYNVISRVTFMIFPQLKTIVTELSGGFWLPEWNVYCWTQTSIAQKWKWLNHVTI